MIGRFVSAVPPADVTLSVTFYSHVLHLVSGTLDLAHHRPAVGVLHPADQAQAQALLLCVLQHNAAGETKPAEVCRIVSQLKRTLTIRKQTPVGVRRDKENE